MSPKLKYKMIENRDFVPGCERVLEHSRIPIFISGTFD